MHNKFGRSQHFLLVQCIVVAACVLLWKKLLLSHQGDHGTQARLQVATYASGLLISSGFVRCKEVSAGEVQHALQFTLPHAQFAYFWLARHAASSPNGRNLLPMGQLSRLRADFNVKPFSPTNLVILHVRKRFRIFLADNCGPLFLSNLYAAEERGNEP